MDLPEIPNSTPVVRPATEEVVYGSWYLKSLVFRHDSADVRSRATLVFQPYNWDTGQRDCDPANEVVFSVDDFIEFAAARPKLALVIADTVSCLGVVAEELRLMKLLVECGDSERQDIEAELSAVREAYTL